MVDLVKIRKKKAEKKAAEAAAAAAAESSSLQVDKSGSESSSRQVVESSSGEKPQAPEESPVIASRQSGEAPVEPPVILSRQRREAASDDEGSADSGATVREPSAAETPAPKPQSSKLDKFKAEAGKRRETAVAQQEQQQEGERLEALTFLIAGEQYAVDIEKIVEIVTPRPVTRIPNSDDSVLGIISLRGTIVTLLDVRQRLRHPPATQGTADTRIVVVDSGNETTGFTVDRVLRVVKTTRDAVEPHPVVHAGELNDAIRGVFRYGGALTILLDLDKLLDHNALAARPA